MNFNKRQNEFSDIPGFDVSKGERIAQVFNKLWEKLQYLDQNKTPGKNSRLETLHSSDYENLTLMDIQRQLFFIQVQYLRTLARRHLDANNEAHHSKTKNTEHDYNLSNKNNTRVDYLHADTVTNSASSDTIQVASHSADGLISDKELDGFEAQLENARDAFENFKYKHSTGMSNATKHSTLMSNATKHSTEMSNATKHSTEMSNATKHSTEMSNATNQRAVPSSSKSHYHLKLDDVPFILGASSTASHSVVANVQNVIAMMKSHNKALCGAKPTVARRTVTNAHSTNFTEKNPVEENKLDVTKMLNNLTKELCDLVERQQKLAKHFDATQIEKHDHDINAARNTPNQGNNINFQIEKKSSRRDRSVSESDIKLHAEIRKTPKMKEKNFVRPSAHSSQSSYSVKYQPSNLSIMDRRKLLRSLQTFKRHLSQEDISWN